MSNPTSNPIERIKKSYKLISKKLAYSIVEGTLDEPSKVRTRIKSMFRVAVWR